MEIFSDFVFREAIDKVNKTGFAAIEIDQQTLTSLGKNLYQSIDKVTLHPNRSKYYNEITFY